MSFSQVIGFSGTALVAVAYIPQIHHLIREHCSAGISIKAYGLWFVASLLFLIHATMITDVVFIGVQLVNLVAISIIVVCAKSYEKQVCETHASVRVSIPARSIAGSR
ncbi:MAG: PQ-loop domain-containing transporter [Acidobacteriota bacterium]